MSHQDHSRSSSRSRRSHKRAAVACTACHARKVRCTVALSGRPCANCAADGTACEIAHRKRRMNPDQLSDPSATTPEERHHPTIPPSCSQDRQGSGADDCLGEWSAMGLVAKQITNESSDVAAEPENSPSVDGLTTGTRNPYYLGDERGPRALVMDICHHDHVKTTRHIFLSVPNTTSTDQEDFDYLKRKGCLSLPSQGMQDALIRAYFHYVHPFAPIIDVDDFVHRYTTGQLSLLLLWSMFAAAGSFIDEQRLTGELGSTRIELKAESFRRAKILYDLEYEKETISLIQSTYLMSYRLGSVDDLKGPWYWMGIAVNLAYTAGLHRLPSYESQNNPNCRSRLWSQLWWSVYCREAWQSLGFGRPMRIHLDEVTTPVPTQDEVASVSVEFQSELYQKFLPPEIDDLAGLWLCLIGITRALGNILTRFYAAQSARPTQLQMDDMEYEIKNCFCGLPNEGCKSPVMMTHIHQIRLYQEATMIVLYRPHIQHMQDETSNTRQDTLQSLCFRKMRAAALRVTHVINMMIGENLTRNIHMQTVIAIVPPMQIHLIDLMSTNSPTRQAGEHNLQLCMVLLDDLRGTHASADATHCLFKTAINKIKNRAPLGPFSQLTPASGSEHLTISRDETEVTGDRGLGTETRMPVSYLDLLPMMSPDLDFSMDD